MFVQDILHQMPFHTDALLLMSSIYERDENFASARQAIGMFVLLHLFMLTYGFKWTNDFF